MPKARTSRQQVNNQPAVLNTRTINPKWFIYQPNTVNGTYKAEFKPLKAPTDKKKLNARKHCYDMFFTGCVNTLKFCLDPARHKRFQRNIKVGSMDPDYFHQYFSQEGGVAQKNRRRIINYYGNKIITYCPAYEFTTFQSLPGLFNDGKYAYISWNATTRKLVKHPLFDIFQFVEDVFAYRMYYTKIVFICNPITYMVSIDFEVVKERRTIVNGEYVWVMV